MHDIACYLYAVKTQVEKSRKLNKAEALSIKRFLRCDKLCMQT